MVVLVPPARKPRVTVRVGAFLQIVLRPEPSLVSMVSLCRVTVSGVTGSLGQPQSSPPTS
jgi:hypothetical protein